MNETRGQTSGGPFNSSTVVCSIHGLRYDPSASTGCIRCRASARPAPPGGGSRRTALAIAASIVLIAGVGLAAWRLLPSAPTALGSASAFDPSRVRRLRTTNGPGRSGVYYIPQLPPGSKVPLLVFVHGTNGGGKDGVPIFGPLAEERGFAILAPDSSTGPDGAYNWEVGDHPGDVTGDRRHVMASLAELLSSDGFSLDTSHVLVVGHSGGGSSAPYLATNEEPFTAFAVLHGGAYPGGFGRRSVRGWFSTGREDHMRPPSGVRDAYEASRGPGAQCEMHVFEGGHAIGDEERRAVVAWWLGITPR